jgi:F-type H+-transporting ATPase subunit gamma
MEVSIFSATIICGLSNMSQNASKNAGDMINRFQILFNRTRQAVITGELVEIITGATASEDS